MKLFLQKIKKQINKSTERVVTFNQSSDVQSLCALAHFRRFSIIVFVRSGFFAGRQQVKPISLSRRRTVMSEISIPDSWIKFVRIFRGFFLFWTHISFIFRSSRGVVIFFLPDFPVLIGERAAFALIFFFILSTDDFATPAIIAIFLCEFWFPKFLPAKDLFVYPLLKQRLTTRTRKNTTNTIWMHTNLK